MTSETCGSVSLRGMSMCDAGYSGRTVKIVKELREKFDLARSDLNSPFAQPVCCMDPLRLTVHKIYAQHEPTKLPRVDKILSKHEGHGQRLLCALICKHNLSMVSVLSVLEGNSSGVPIGTGPRLSLSPAVVPKGTIRQKNAVEATHKGTTRERTEENLHDTESCGSGTKWWYLDARRCRRCWLDYGSATLGEMNVERNLERNVVEDDDKPWICMKVFASGSSSSAVSLWIQFMGFSW